MSGHSKWANIKHKKAKEDSKKGKIFTKLIKEITVAAKQGGDPACNPRLRLLLEKSRQENMPAENAIRAIKKGTGELPGVHYDPMMYEGFGPGGIAILVETLSDNKNRTVAEMRTTFSRGGGNLGEANTVNWMFEKKGVVRMADKGLSEDELIEKLLDYNVEDIHIGDGIVTITTDHAALGQVRDALTELGNKIDDAELEWLPKDRVSITPEEEVKAYALLESLEDHDDVQHVFTNLE